MTYPSVTTILAPWANFDKVPPDTLIAACERGQALHQAYAAYALGLWIPELADEYQGYFESWCLWAEQAVAEFVVVEQQFFCPKYKFTGRPDALVRIKMDDFLTLPDWKNGQTEQKTWRLQTAAYHHLVNDKFNVSRVIIVQPRPDGKIARMREYTGTLKADFARFLQCKGAWDYFHGGN